MNHEFEGVYTALVTPFSNDGRIDMDSFDRLLTDQAAAGIKGIVLAGTTGEAPTLTVQEKLSLVRRAKAHGGLQIMAGTGSNNTDQTVELSKLACDAGADSLLITTPPYNKPSTMGLLEHFSVVGKAVNKPLCLYHVPGRTGQKLSLLQMRQLLCVDGVEGVKEASGDIGMLSHTIAQNPDSAVFAGDDLCCLPGLAVGAVGVVSVASNLFPATMVKLLQLFRSGHQQEAIKLNQQLLPLFHALFIESNPGPVKYLMGKRQLLSNRLRLPMVPVQPETEQRLQETMAELEHGEGINS